MGRMSSRAPLVGGSLSFDCAADTYDATRALPEDVAPKLTDALQRALAAAALLPFASGAFRAALTVHVLHLVSSWQAALAEIRRVLAPGGVFIHHFTRYEPNTWAPS